MYSVEWLAKEICWHCTNKLDEGMLGHVVDSSNWKIINHKYPHFSIEPHNVLLGLNTNGFNPYGMKSTSYSTWPMMY